jgi:hypothetical protein
MAMAALLEQPTVVRVVAFRLGQRSQGVGDAPEVPLTDRGNVEDVAVLGYLREQRLRSRERRRELTPLEELADATHFPFDACWLRVESRLLHLKFIPELDTRYSRPYHGLGLN